MAIVAIVDNSGDELFTLDVAGTADGARAVQIKRILLPTGLSSPHGAIHLGGNVVAVIDSIGDELFTFDIAATADGGRAVQIKRIFLPTGLSTPRGITHLGNSIVAVVDDTDSELYTFDIAATADGARATQIKQIDLPTDVVSPQGITSLGNNVLAVVDAAVRAVFIFNVEATANGARATQIKRVNLPTGISTPRGITYIGNNIVAVVDEVNDELTTFDVEATADGGTATQIKQIDLPTGLTTPRGITALQEEVAVLEMTVSPTSVRTGQAATVTFTFGGSVGDFTAADVKVSAGTKGALTDKGGNVYTMPVTAPATGTGTVTVSVDADVVTPGNNADSVSFAYAPPPLTASFSAPSPALREGVQGTIRVVFSVSNAALSALALSHFESEGATLDAIARRNATTWDITVTPDLSGLLNRVRITLPENTIGSNEESTADFYAVPNARLVAVNSGLDAGTGISEVYRFPKFSAPDTAPAAADVEKFTITAISNPHGIVFHGDTLYIGNDSSSVPGLFPRIYRVPANTANGGTVAGESFQLPNDVASITGLTISVDGNTLYVLDLDSRAIFLVAANTATDATATIIRRINIPFLPTSNPSDTTGGFTEAIVLVGSSLLLLARRSRRAYYIPENTANNTEAVITKTVNLAYTAATPFGVADDGEYLFSLNPNRDRLYIFREDTADGENVDVLQNFPLPPGLTDGRGLTLDPRIVVAPTPDAPTFTAGSAYAVNERGSRTIDSRDVFSGHTSLEVQDGETLPDYVTISGLNVVITNAPDVTMDTEVSLPLTARNAGGTVDGTIIVDISQIDPAPTFGTIGRQDINEGSSTVIDLSSVLKNTESLAEREDSFPSWATISGLTVVVTNAELVDTNTDFTLRLTARSSKTDATADGSVTIRVVHVPEPDAVLAITVNPTSVQTGQAATVTFTFDKSAGDFTAADVNVSAGTKGALTDEGNNVYTMPVTAPSTGTGTITVSVDADVVTPGNNADSVSFAYAPPPPDPVVPSAPSVSVSTANPRSLVLSIALGSDGGSQITALEYSIDRNAWQRFPNLSTTQTLSRLEKGTRYNIRVRAVNAIGNSPASSAITGTTATTVPNAPSISVTDTGPTTLEISITAGSDDGGEDLTDVEVSIAEGRTPSSSYTALGSVATTHTFTGLEKGTQYTIRVRTRNTQGASPASNAVSATTETTVASANQNLRVTDKGPDYIEYAWDAPLDDGGTQITDHELAIAAGNTPGTNFVATGSTDRTFRATELNPNTQYTAVVRAVNAQGAGAASNAVSETTEPPPDAVLEMTVNPSSVEVGQATTVRFDFTTQIGSVSEFTASDVNVTVGATKRALIHRGGGAYTMEVVAPGSGAGTVVVSVDADVVSPGNNAASVSFMFMPRAPIPPGQTIGVAVELTPTTALITWERPTDGIPVTGFEIAHAEGSSAGTNFVATGSTRTRHLIRGLARGTLHTFAVRAVNDDGVGPTSSPVTERTPIASLHNALFFKECVNYLDDGVRVSEHRNAANIIRAVSDNDYGTFSTETDYDINIAVNGQPTRVDAVFVKGIGIEGHSAVPTGGSGVGYSNRRMPATVKNWEGTDVSTIVNGFQHDLYLLDQHFTATSVRLTFTGTNVKIVEVMLLEFGISIDANGDFTEINPDFVDRSGEIHSAPGGSLGYGAPIGTARDKWEIDYAVKVVPGKTLLETPEEFLYWRSGNRNHVHAQEPSRFPWRVFPATFVGERVPVRYRTDDKTGGEILSFRVAEQ